MSNMPKIIKIKWVNLTEEDKKSITFHTEENYKRLILQNYFLYNHRARRDIAIILYDRYQKEIKEHPTHIAANKNIFSEIYSKLIQVSEDLALVCMILLKQRTPLQVYMESDNGDIKNFYVSAFKGFSDKEMIRMLGFERVYQYIESNAKLASEEKQNLKNIINQAITIEKNNLKILGNIYIDQLSPTTNNLEQGGPIDVYNSIKHGYKAVYPTKIAKIFWKEINEKSYDMMHQLLDDETTGKKIVRVGGFKEITTELVESIMHNIQFYSDSLFSICETALLSEKKVNLIIGKLRLAVTDEKIKNGQKIKHFEKCLCGSGKHYNKCCDLFRNNSSYLNMLKELEIM